MDTLGTGNLNVNGTIEEAIAFAAVMAERGEYGRSTSRNYAGALRQFADVLDDTDPRDARWMLENIEHVGRRWGVKHESKPETIRAYLVRAKALLEDFLAFRTDPMTFKGRSRPAAGTTDDKPKRKASVDQSKETAPPASSASTTSPAFTMTFPTPNGPFVIQVPSDEKGQPNFDCEDAVRMAMAVLTMARDFSPGASRARMYGLLNPTDDDE